MTCGAKLLLGDHPLRIKYLTTDTDGKACKGFQQVMSSATLQSTENETDLNHSLCRAVTQARQTCLQPEVQNPRGFCSSKRLLKMSAIKCRPRSLLAGKKNIFKNNIAFDRSITSCMGMTKCFSGNHWECSKKSFIYISCKKNTHKKRKKHYRSPPPFMSKGIRGLLQIEGDITK